MTKETRIYNRERTFPSTTLIGKIGKPHAKE